MEEVLSRLCKAQPELQRTEIEESELWKPIPGFSEYEASTLGNIRNNENKHLLNKSRDVTIFSDADSESKKCRKWHCWIALTFVPNPTKQRIVHHINGNRKDDRAANLRWGNPVSSETGSEKFSRCLEQNRLNREGAWKALVESHGTASENGCVLASKPYKNIGVAGTNIRIHQYAFLLFNVEHSQSQIREKALVVRHMCGNNRCFNPAHLELGTQADNMRDRERHNTHSRGAMSYMAKINEATAIKIIESQRAPSEPDYLTRKERAEKFDVSIATVRHIDKKESWLHLQQVENNRVTDKRLAASQRLKAAKSRIWTNDMFEEAWSFLSAKLVDKPSPVRTVEGECREWTGGTQHGYGKTSVHGKEIKTHILAAECFLKRHRRADEITRHLCGNRICCNPLHLKFGTSTENAIDAIKHGSKRAKLKADDILAIRQMLKEGFSCPDIAKHYGMEAKAIRNIRNGKSWAHIEA